ncbi:MAG: DUF418 domain-containing protein [Oceanicaulis sp.]
MSETQEDSKPAGEKAATGAALSAAPVAAGDRHESLDVLRGVAVLGILMVNIQAFMMYANAYVYPPAHMDVTGANATAWLVTHVFFELKFITLFSAMFGAGVVLMVGEKREASKKLHFSRMRWMLVFGVVHMFALWFGDILTTYAIAGFIIVFFRHMSPAKLIIWGLVWITISGLLYVALFGSFALIPEDAGMSDVDLGMRLSGEDMDALVGSYEDGWLTSRIPNAINGAMGLLSLPFFGGRVIGVMFIGMALFKLGFLTAKWSAGGYLAALVAGLGIGLPLVAWGGLGAVESGFVLSELWKHTATNYVGSLFVSFGYASAVMLICKAPWLKLLRLPFAAAGRMAFTNYLTQSIVMVALATGVFGPALFGQLERVEQIQLVLVVWVVQLIVSPIWLSVFRFGPFEWLWRSLSYGKLQPILKTRPAGTAPA